ncbi:cytochrome b561 domain-containing protein At4g18260-like isoform X2 [Andrographis paniculata]|nr:cytochrome b561 domain-containing protein At4g18260-like isoform X2 [Andrographis paniculata]XP_051136289.1 cytochrome b561 domain-containing protein At4g18260-like isoform X2 [Andrographis paniculata]
MCWQGIGFSNKMRDMLVSKKLAAVAIFVGIVVLNPIAPVGSVDEDTPVVAKINSGNKDKIMISSQLSFEIKLHGFLWWASVGLLMPAGILVKRILNNEASGRRLKIVFYVHAFMEISAVLIGTAAAAMSIKYFDNTFNNGHQRIGLVFYLVMWLQLLTAIFRPKRGSKGRSMWFFLHWLLGIAVPLLGVINIYTGLQAYHGRTSKNVGIWTIIFTVQISILLFFYLLQDKWPYIQKQGMILRNDPVSPTDHEMSSPHRQKEARNGESC